MEPHKFRNATTQQTELDQLNPGLFKVIHVVLRSSDSPTKFSNYYWGDHDAADHRFRPFVGQLDKFDVWRQNNARKGNPRMRQISVLRHLMGNRVLRYTIKNWNKKFSASQILELFRKSFIAASVTLS
jgi:hypothetical protein